MTRDQAICRDYLGGHSQEVIARQVGLSQSMVSRILAAHGIQTRRAHPRSPQTRQAIAATIRLKWQQGLITASPRLPIPSDLRGLYNKARAIGGASYAKGLLGIAA